MKAILVIDVDEIDLNTDIISIEFANGTTYCCNKRLKPMPKRKLALFNPNHCDMEEEIKIIQEINGYNRCIDEILGETE